MIERPAEGQILSADGSPESPICSGKRREALAIALRLATAPLLALTVYAVLLDAFCFISLATADAGWRFCYDGPSAELVLLFAVPAAGLLGLAEGLLLAARRLFSRTASRRWARARLLGLGAPVGLSILVALGLVAGRSFGEWAVLKRELQRAESAVEARVGTSPLPLTRAQYDLLRQEIPMPTLNLRMFRQPVRIRVMGTVPPFVGADFGQGSNAQFDPDTMWCTYAD